MPYKINFVLENFFLEFLMANKHVICWGKFWEPYALCFIACLNAYLDTHDVQEVLKM